MNSRPLFSILPLVAAMLVPAAAAQQRVEFQRQKFDRSRFERPDSSLRPPAAAGIAAAPAAAEPAPVSVAPSAEMPASPAAEFSGGSGFPAAPAAASDSAPPAPSVFSSNAVPPSLPPPGGSPYPANATDAEKAAIDAPLLEEIPAKWFDDAKDYEALLELQKKTGACMLVYFKNPFVTNEKGLCGWFEKNVATDLQWRKAIKNYVKLQITYIGNEETKALIAQFRANKTPAFFVVKPGGTFPARIQLFDYTPNSRPEPRDVATILESIKVNSTPAYAGLF
ncbi:MAG: hypothetical protein AB7V14_04935 [Kiritimatiellia bacterium]